MGYVNNQNSPAIVSVATTPHMDILRDFSAKGDGITNDWDAFKRAMDTIPTGWTLLLPKPKVKYCLDGEVKLRSDITIKGEDVTIVSASTTSATNVFLGQGVSNVEISGVTFESTMDKASYTGRVGNSSNKLGIHLVDATNIRIHNAGGKNLEYFLKVDATSSDLEINEIKTVNTRQPVFLSYVSRVRGRSWDLNCPIAAETDVSNHQIYISDDVHDVVVDQIILSGSVGFSIQIQGVNTSTSSVNFNNVKFNGTDGGVTFIGKVSGCRVRNVSMHNLANSAVAWQGSVDSTNNNNWVEGLHIYNPLQVDGGELISSISNNGTNGIDGGYIEGAKKRGFLFSGANQFVCENVHFKNCIAGNSTTFLFSNTGFGHDKLFFRNNTFHDTTAPAIEACSLRGTAFSEFVGNTFIADAMSTKRVFVNTTTGTHYLRNNSYMGYPDLISATDTQSIGIMNTNLTTGQVTNKGVGFAGAQSDTAAATATSGTIATAGVKVARVNPVAAITGVILQAGTFGGQEVTVINEAAAANSVTFAASATSKVADGVSDVIPGGTARAFVWDSGVSLWYRVS